MKKLKIEKHKWQPNFPNETWIRDETNQRTFTMILKEESIEIECEWDYGHGGRGTERMEIPVEQLMELIFEL